MLGMGLDVDVVRDLVVNATQVVVGGRDFMMIYIGLDPVEGYEALNI